MFKSKSKLNKSSLKRNLKKTRKNTKRIKGSGKKCYKLKNPANDILIDKVLKKFKKMSINNMKFNEKPSKWQLSFVKKHNKEPSKNDLKKWNKLLKKLKNENYTCIEKADSKEKYNLTIFDK